MERKRLLIVSAYFAPSGCIGGRRAEKLAASFVKQGWDVDVLTLDPEVVPPIDATLKVPDGVRVLPIRPRVHPMLVHSIMQRGVWQTIKLNNSVLRSLLFNPASRFLLKRAADAGVLCHSWFWISPALNAVKDRHYDLVIGSVPPVSAATIAQRVARRTGARLVLDYRDPWIDVARQVDPKGVAAHFVKRLDEAELGCLSETALISAVSPTLGSWAEAKSKKPVRVLPQGYEPSPPCRPPSDDAITPLLCQGHAGIVFYYAGVLLYRRSLVPLFKLAKAIAQDGATPCHVIYSGPHETVARAQADSVGADNLLVSTGQITYSEANHIMSNATANVVVISDDYEYMYPGKLWDSMAVGRPIIVIGKPECDSARLVRERNLGIVLPPCEEPDASSFLEKLRAFDSSDLSSKTQDLQAACVYDAFVQSFERQQA